MTKRELRASTREFDKADVESQSRPLNEEERAQWRRLKRKRGRPKNGKGFQRISVSMEKGLLKQVAALAKRRHVTRSKLLALVVEEALAKAK